MVTVRYNKPATFGIRYVGGKYSWLELNPGINLNFPDSELKPLRKHPVWMAMLEVGEIEILRYEPSSEGNLEGFEVVEDRKTGQPMPIQDTSVDEPIVQGQPKKEEPKIQVQVQVDDGLTRINSATKSELIELPAIGPASAKKLMDARPFTDLDAAKVASGLSDAQWEKVEPLILVD